MLINENRLGLADPRARKYLAEQMEKYFLLRRRRDRQWLRATGEIVTAKRSGGSGSAATSTDPRHSWQDSAGSRRSRSSQSKLIYEPDLTLPVPELNDIPEDLRTRMLDVSRRQVSFPTCS